MIKKEITDYVEQRIIPRYACFDKAHREDHALSVISRSLELAAKMEGADETMAYVVAAFHDLGLVNGRENHHHDSRLILEADEFLRMHFTAEEIRLMGEAVEDHRASAANRPRNVYGLIVAEADRLIEPVTIVRRTISYGLSHFPELDRRGHYERTLSHLKEKYGPEGYLKCWIPESDNAVRLRELHALMADESRIADLFNRLFDEESAAE